MLEIFVFVIIFIVTHLPLACLCGEPLKGEAEAEAGRQ
jgi:hypothetical protein